MIKRLILVITTILFVVLITTTNAQKAKCQFDPNKSMLILNYEGNSSIVCDSIGVTHCFNDDISCSTNDQDTEITCSTKGNLSCIGSVIDCSINNGEFVCSVNFPKNQTTATPIPSITTYSPTTGYTTGQFSTTTGYPSTTSYSSSTSYPSTTGQSSTTYPSTTAYSSTTYSPSTTYTPTTSYTTEQTTTAYSSTTYSPSTTSQQGSTSSTTWNDQSSEQQPSSTTLGPYCRGQPVCGGTQRGSCTPNGCVCNKPWGGMDCSSQIIDVSPPQINSTDPSIGFSDDTKSEIITTTATSEIDSSSSSSSSSKLFINTIIPLFVSMIIFVLLL